MRYADGSTVLVRWKWKLGFDLYPELVQLGQGPAASSRCFDMGSAAGDDDERPVRRNICVEPFAIGKTEVTFDEYDAFVLANRVGSADSGAPALAGDHGWGRGRRPVINVRWNDAVKYADWLGEQIGQVCSLPSEVEWEFAARAGTDTQWHWGNDESRADEYAWHAANSDGATRPVAMLQPNAWGLHDTAGNVWEWVHDCWHDSYDNAPSSAEPWLSTYGDNCGLHVQRGGSWQLTPYTLRPSNRSKGLTGAGEKFDLGFRVLCRARPAAER